MTDEVKSVDPIIDLISEAAVEAETVSVPTDAERIAALESQLAAAVQSRQDLLTRTLKVARKYAVEQRWCAIADKALAEIDPALTVPGTVHDVTVTVRLRLVNQVGIAGNNTVALEESGVVNIYTVRDYVRAVMGEVCDEDLYEPLLDVTIIDTVYQANPDGSGSPWGMPTARTERFRTGEDYHLVEKVLPLGSM